MKLKSDACWPPQVEFYPSDKSSCLFLKTYNMFLIYSLPQVKFLETMCILSPQFEGIFLQKLGSVISDGWHLSFHLSFVLIEINWFEFQE